MIEHMIHVTDEHIPTTTVGEVLCWDLKSSIIPTPVSVTHCGFAQSQYSPLAS